jgi:predicted amidohydrolase
VLAAAVQLNSTEDTDRNLERADRLVREAAARGAELVLLPEKWSVLGRGEAMAAAAEPLDGRSISWARSVARELGIDLIAGSIVELREGAEKRANTSVHVDPHGELRGVYRKLHMFDVEIDGVLYAESAHEQPGEELVLSELHDGRLLGMTICYDVRFPELYRTLAAAGAQLLSIPSAFTLPTTRDHWEVLVRARAIENACFVLAANQIGAHPPGNRCGGRSLIVDPWGVVLACAPDGECAILAELDFELQGRVRRRLPALAHRRPDVYAREPRIASAGERTASGATGTQGARAKGARKALEGEPKPAAGAVG